MSMDNPLELLVVGAGPHALAVVARLAYGAADRLTEREHAAGRRAGGERGEDARPPFEVNAETVAVVDPHGSWIASWSRCLESQGVEWLRSPESAHPDPSSPAALREFATARGRLDEIVPLPLETLTSLRRRLGADWHQGTPSRRLFDDFCHATADRYGLGGLVRAGFVASLGRDTSGLVRAEVSPTGGEDGGGAALYARRVVLAVGAGLAVVPDWVPRDSPRFSHATGSLRPADPLPWPHRAPEAGSAGGEGGRAAPKNRRWLVVGAGLSGVSTAVHALDTGAASHVTVLSRVAPRVQLFDTQAKWTGGRFRNATMATFLMEGSAAARQDRLSVARPSGTVSPRMHRRLLREITAGRVTLEVVPDAGRCDRRAAELSARAARVVLATGARPDTSLVEQLAGAAGMSDGMPLLDERLQVKAEGGVFVIGAAAALQLGPDAHNLTGAVRAANIVYDAVMADVVARGRAGAPAPGKSASGAQQDVNPFDLLCPSSGDEDSADEEDGDGRASDTD